MIRSATIIGCATLVFAVAASVLSTSALTTLLNGLFAGSLVSLAIVVRSLVWNSVSGQLQYRDVSVFTLGLFMVMVGLAVWVLTSIYISASDIYTPVFLAAAFAKHCVVCGLLTMAYSPDIGVGLFDGRDRKAIAISVASGLLVAAIVVYLQRAMVLA